MDQALTNTEDLQESMQETGSKLRTAAANAVSAAGEQLGRLGETVLHTTQSLEERLAEGIRKYPVSSVLIAAGLGTVIGLFMFRRSL
jgi:ElaB/YqjD/DUF883 family membrane-anchored ribosome-binding protein